MPYEELLGWFAYFEKRPVGWRDDDRTHKLLQAQGVKEKAYKLFPSLDPIYNHHKSDDFSPAGFKASFMFHKMLGAKGGDALDL